MRDLVIANRILANEGVLDAYGHVSVRDLDDASTFWMARSLSPELVGLDDLMAFDPSGEPRSGDSRPPCLERFIHAGVYEARPDGLAVVHGHTESLLPFGITSTPLIPVFHAASDMGTAVPVWDIRDRFADTDMLVQSAEQGRDLANTLGQGAVALMRGHGFVAVGGSLVTTVRLCVNLARNARVLLWASLLGGPVRALSEGEVRLREHADPTSPAIRRGWEYWAIRAGCGDLLQGHR